jgi:hypothetical protein
MNELNIKGMILMMMRQICVERINEPFAQAILLIFSIK